jgi:two-component system, NtrC family, response regulator HydG
VINSREEIARRRRTLPIPYDSVMTRRKGEGFDDVETLARPQAKRSSSAPPSFVVHVVSGPDAGKHVVVDGTQRVLVGTSPVCALALSDREVSRRHFSLDVERGRVRLVDLESTNGTFVNGLAVRDVTLAGGETIALGATQIAVAPSNAAVAPATEATRFGKIVGGSAEMRRLYPLCARLAASTVPVVIEGETGTGKEVLAESIHEQGPRANGPFVVFDCTALPGNLLEAALFGHERGAFTGADQARAGVFEDADGGTLLIDEIGDLDIALQAKLLRAIERSEVRRLGGKGFVQVDVRIIAATRRDLDREVQEGRFRDDLFFRLAVARIELPPLRERHGDITVLTRMFWSALGGPGTPPREIEERFEAYGWPGNVRELRNAVARQIALGDHGDTGMPRSRPSAANAPFAPGSARGTDPFAHVLELDLPLPRARQMIVDEFERAYVERVLAKNGGSVVKAAQASGLARRYFQILRARLR